MWAQLLPSFTLGVGDCHGYLQPHEFELLGAYFMLRWSCVVSRDSSKLHFGTSSMLHSHSNKFEKLTTLFLRWLPNLQVLKAAENFWRVRLTSWSVERCHVQTNEGLLRAVPLGGGPVLDGLGVNCLQSFLSNFFMERLWSYCCKSPLHGGTWSQLYHTSTVPEMLTGNMKIEYQPQYSWSFITLSTSLPPIQHPCISLQCSGAFSATLSKKCLHIINTPCGVRKMSSSVLCLMSSSTLLPLYMDKVKHHPGQINVLW